MGVKMLVLPGWGPAVAVIASARSPYGTAYWPPGGSESIIYEFNDLMITDLEKVGQAFYDSKFYCTSNYGWSNYAEYINMYTFNLWGDPSLTREGIDLAGIGTDPGVGAGGRSLELTAWPSPARGSVRISCSLPAGESASLWIFDVLGRRVRRLDVPVAAERDRSLTWDGRMDDGVEAAPGIYWIEVTAAGQSATDRIVLVR
jgi:hypothetical protein